MSGTAAIVGSSVAGVRTAQALRSEGYDGDVVLIGAEPHLPYDKPPLSKQFLAGAWDTDRIALLTTEAASDDDIELRLGVPAVEIDAMARRIVLADGASIAYDSVVIATGADARPSPWVTPSGVHVIRTLDDSRRLREELDTPDDGAVVIVGAGFIGAEVAATAHSLGREVTVVDPLPAPLGRIAGPEIGAILAGIHSRHGVSSRFGIAVTDVQGEAGDLRVALSDGEVLAASVVVVGIGATPHVAWLESSGFPISDGVLCDEYGRVVDHQGAFAAGDVARWFHPRHGEHLRAEHWTNATEQAACVAHNIVNPETPRAHSATEFVWSDQYDWKIQIAGTPEHCSSHQLIGDPAAPSPRFAALYRNEDGELGGALTVNWAKALVTCRRLINAGETFDAGLSQIEGLAAPAVGA